MNLNAIEEIESGVLLEMPILKSLKVENNNLKCLDLDILSTSKGLQVYIEDSPNLENACVFQMEDTQFILEVCKR